MKDVVRYVLVPALVGGLVGLLVMFANLFEPSTARPGYAAAVKRASPSVVNIYTSAAPADPAICRLPEFRRYCDNRMQSSLGSGVVVSSDGYILTNNHVIDGADEILVAFSTGQATVATLVGGDSETDLAVIKVAATGLPVIPTVDTDVSEVGDVALAIGNPFGIGQTVSSGIISAKGRAGISQNPYDDFIQTDAAINPGNSGGALIDADGNLLGINTLIFSRSGGSVGIGFAIPTDLAFSVLTQIIRNGRVTRGWLGAELAEASIAGQVVGLHVACLYPGGPGALSGLRTDDVIISLNGKPANNSMAVIHQIAHIMPGDAMNLEVVRGPDRISLTAKSGERPLSQRPCPMPS
jgi:serine protease DegS